MAYEIRISKQDVSYNAEDGTPLDGDRRVIRDHLDEVDVYDPACDEGSPVEWAAGRLSRTDAAEPSVHPVPGELPASAWLSGTYAHPYLDETLETSARLEGDWTPAQRAEVFRLVSQR